MGNISAVVQQLKKRTGKSKEGRRTLRSSPGGVRKLEVRWRKAYSNHKKSHPLRSPCLSATFDLL
jgi:hypothetical protein